MLWKKLLATQQQGGVPDDYIAYWNSISGSTLQDATGSYNMAIVGASTVGGGGVGGGDALSFDGTNDYCNTTAIPTLTGSMAVSIWAKTDSTSPTASRELFWHKALYGARGQSNTAAADGTGYRLLTTGYVATSPASGGLPDTTNFHNIIINYNNATGDLDYYLNGTLEGTVDASGTLETPSQNQTVIGAFSSGSLGSVWLGDIATETRLYDRSLTGAEIAALAAEF